MKRPRTGSEDKRTSIFKMRLTPAEKLQLLELATQAGLTPSDFVRVRTIGSKPLTRKATADRAALIRLQAELNKVGSNANQIARALNRRSDSDTLSGIDASLINDALAGIKTITTQIAQELGHGHSGE